MKLEYVGEVLPDGHLSVDPSILSKLKKGDKLRVRIEPMALGSKSKSGKKDELDPATKRLLSSLENAPRLGAIKGEVSREAIYEDRADEKF